jgi:pimeloyl-ACP methyl ester carboxylesterase
MTALRVREYGSAGPMVIAIHGGPAAAGSAAPIARGLSERFHVLEPWQRGTDAFSGPLTLDVHIRDLRNVIVSRCPEMRPALVGESWGAMLALAFAAAHPDLAGPIVLVGCGTWNAHDRARLGEALERRIDQDQSLRAAIERLPEQYPGDSKQQMLARYELTRHLYDFCPLSDEPDPDAPGLDESAHKQTWDDMLRLQALGRYPAAFAAIVSPVLMIHGQHDPHPGPETRDTLREYIPGLEYVELPRCGHSPWHERFARDEFFARVRDWLLPRVGA